MVRPSKGWSLGLGGSDHDFSAALMRGTDIRVAIEQERLSRTKNGLSLWYREPLEQAVRYCLDAEGVRLEDIELVAASDTLPARTRHSYAGHDLRLFSHHLCHAASAYLVAPPGSTAGVLVYDGYGSIVEPGDVTQTRASRETFSFYLFSPDGYQCLGGTTGLSFREQDDFPIGISNSIGMLYEVVTCALGYGPMDSGKTMGLAAHGAPRHLASLERLIELADDYSRCFTCPTDSSAVVDCVEQILDAGRGSFATKADLAASVQQLVNRVLQHCAGLFGNHQIDCIAIGGGCGLNTVANSALVEQSTACLPVVIPPHCGDAGLGLGALWLAASERLGRSANLTFREAAPAPKLSRPGRLYTEEERARAIQAFYPRLSRDVSIVEPADLARLLADGAIIGVFNGRSEIGPRALGGRSILADPRNVATRERLNRSIKDREPFRPFGPIVLASAYGRYFENLANADPYMLKVSRVTDKCRLEAPAIVHVDGTARVQVLDDDADPLLLGILGAFNDLTGLPILINTSFNRRGEPIVETPLDAVDAFLGLNLDGLFLDGDFYRQAYVHPSR